MQSDIKPSAPKGPYQPSENSPKPEPDVVIDEQALEAKSEPSQTAGKLPPHKLLVAHIKHHWWNNWGKKQKIIASVSALVIVLLLAGGSYALFHHGNIPFSPYNPGKEKAAIKPTTVASPLSGLQVAPALAARPVTAIMIENSLDARPQSGLQDAGIVYEAIAEAGITRFMALYQDTSPQYIGPVRSLRPYYIDFAAPFQASIVHVGGSPDALSEVQNGDFRNLDQFYNGSYFQRIDSRDAPHNVYTSFTQLDQLNQSKGYTKSTFTPFERKADSKLKTPTAKTVDLTLSGTDYNVHYDYDSATNSYARSEGGAPHLDLVSSGDSTGVQLKPKVVIALVVPLSNGELDSSGAYYSNYADIGSGQMYVFQDGGVTQGTWVKQDTTSQYQFTDQAGHSLKLNAGQTWITLVGTTSDVSYAP